MSDPFDLFGGNDVKSSSTIDDDFEALFGSIGGDANSKESGDEKEAGDLDDFLKPTEPEPASAQTAKTDPTQTFVPSNFPDSSTEKKKDSERVAGNDNTLIDVEDVGTGNVTEASVTPDMSGSATNKKSLNLNKDKLFSFDDNDPGLDGILFLSSSSSKRDEDKSAFSDAPQQQTSDFSESGAASKDIFDIFAPKSETKPVKISGNTSSLDDIFGSDSFDNKEIEDFSVDPIFAPQNNPTNKRKNDSLDDIFGQSTDAKVINIKDAPLEDIFASPARKSRPLVDEGLSHKHDTPVKDDDSLSDDWTLLELEDSTVKTGGSIFEDLTTGSDKTPNTDGDDDETDCKSSCTDLLADLPTATPAPTATGAASSADEVTSPAGSKREDLLVSTADAKEMDQEQGEVAQGGQPQAVPDILDFLEDACPDLPDISTLESDSTNKTEQLDLISGHNEDTLNSKRDHHSDFEFLQGEEDDALPTKAKKKRECDDDNDDEGDDDKVSPVAAARNVKLSLTAPSCDLGDEEESVFKSGTQEEKDEGVSGTLSNAEWKEDELTQTEKSRKLKEELNSDPDFMDFSILAMPEESHLNVDISKHKRTLSKKGSMALRKKPSRRAIRSSGAEGDDALFKDSTEPKPPAMSDEDDDQDDRKEDAEVMGAWGSGSREPTLSGGGGEVARAPFKPPMTGGVKIPGLLEGLKKSKSFKSQEPKKTNASIPANTKKDEEKEEINFRSLLKSTPSSSSSSSLPSKTLKESQNQSIAQTPPPSSIKPSDLRRQPMAGSIKLPALIKSSSPTDKLKKPSPALTPRVPPPVSTKPKPSLPTAKPRLSPIIKPEQTSNSASASSSNADGKKKSDETAKNIPPIASSSLEDKKSTTTTTTTTASLLSDTTSSPSTLKSSTASATTTTTTNSSAKSATSSSSSILSSIRPKPYTPPKPRPRPSPATKPTKIPSTSDSATTKSDTAQPGNKLEEDGDNSKSSRTILEKSDLFDTPTTTKARTSSLSSTVENGQDATDSVLVTKPRKSSISGVSSVQSPIGPDRSAPRKSSISGSAYAPMGFKRSISNEGSEKSEEKPESISRERSDSKVRTSSITESSEKEKDSDTGEKIESNTEKGEKSNGTIDKQFDIEDEDKVKPKEILQKDNRLSEKSAEKSSSIKSSSNNKPEPPQKPMWGVQLRKVDRKPATPSKPVVDTVKEVESPANWRQQLANKRKSITPKDTPTKEPETNVPEWAKASIERRKRLMESGVIKSEAK